MGENTIVEPGQLVLTVAYGLIGLGTFIIARMLMQEQETRAASENIADQRNRKADNPLVNFTRPIYQNYIVPIIRGKKYWDASRLKYRRMIVSSGLKDEFTADEFISFKLLNIIFFPLVLGILKALGFLDLPVIVILAAGGAGWFYPDFWVKGRITERQGQIRKSMPFVVDLLALSTEAGLDFMGAIGKVVAKAAPSPLIDEFEQVLKEVRVGSSRTDALREMAIRINMPEIGSFIAILISAEQMGASIGNVLRQQSDSIRSDRLVRAEKAGALIAQKLMMPIVVFMVPSVFIMIFAPFIIQFLTGQMSMS